MSINTKCQVFTPNENVQKLLDYVGYRKNLCGKKIAENSCGDGNILSEIVKRYIEDNLKSGMIIETVKKGLAEDIWGAEIDCAHIQNCISRLDKVAAQYGITDVKWNIFHGDFLKGNITNEFDFVVGNPPYITYKELDIETRAFVREKFDTCAIGKFDYCYAFIEASIKSLKRGGKLAYLIPSNIFKNQFAQELRNYILPYLTDIYDYRNQKLFAGKLTASAIIVCDVGKYKKEILYHNLVEKKSNNIKKCELEHKWIFQRDKASAQSIALARFGDYFHAASSIATLLNKVFIISDFVDDGGAYICVEGKKIEKRLLRKAVSPRSLNYQIKEYVVFPYYYTKDGLQKYSQTEFCEKFPFAEQYLQQFAEELNNRDNDKGINWFEYGRSQALSHLNQEKLLISTLLTGTAKIASLAKNDIPTSGLYIVPKNGQTSYALSKAKEILCGELFLTYAKSIGVISNGNSFRISPKDINNFMFPMELLGT